MKDQEINRYWKKIIDTMNDALMLIGTDGTIITVNQAFQRLTGYDADEVIGMPCTLLNCDACEKDLKNGKDFWCSLFAGGKDVRKRCLIMKKDGRFLE